MNIKSQNNLPLWIIVCFLGFVVLYLGRNIFVILVFTTLLLILFSGIYSYFYKKIDSNIISAIITAGIFVLFFAIIGFIITSQIESFTENFDKFGQGLSSLISNLGFLGQTLSSFNFQQIFQNVDIGNIGRSTLSVISSILGGLSTVGLLLIFIWLEKDMFLKKIDKITSKKTEKKVETIYKKIYDDLNVFLLSKFSVALMNATISAIIMFSFGLEYALLFALFVFLLDFIPAVGGAIAMTLPFLYSFVQFDTVGMSFFLLACLIIPQFITGNVVEPKLMGNRLNLSSFVIILSLIFWSSIWGVAGSFLAIPLMASINIVLAKFEFTKPIAVLLSKNGEVS